MKNRSKLVEDFWRDGKSEDCPIIDVHGHMGNWTGACFFNAEPDEMIKSMDRAGVDKVIFSHHSALSSPDIMNSRSMEAVRKYSGRFRAYCVVNPNYPDIMERELETYDNNKDIYAGLKFHAGFHNMAYDDKRYAKAWEFADKRKAVVLAHTWGGDSLCGEAVLRKVAEKYSGIQLILGHSLHGHWGEAVKLAQDFNNIYLDLCAVLDERSGLLEKFVSEAGSGKVLFGTDIPWFNFHYYIGGVLAAEITDEDRKNIYYKNARSLFEGKLGL